MTFWVAKNRQKPPAQNAFAERAKRNRQRGGPAKAPAEPQKAPEPSEVADSAPDLQALREAAEKAAALVHEEAPGTGINPDPEETTAGVRTDTPEDESEPEAEKPRRGRKPSAAVQARNARVLKLVQSAGTAGISKPDIAGELGEKEQQVYTSLRQLQGEGKVESKYLDGLGYRWLAL